MFWTTVILGLFRIYNPIFIRRIVLKQHTMDTLFGSFDLERNSFMFHDTIILVHMVFIVNLNFILILFLMTSIQIL